MKYHCTMLCLHTIVHFITHHKQQEKRVGTYNINKRNLVQKEMKIIIKRKCK